MREDYTNLGEFLDRDINQMSTNEKILILNMQKGHIFNVIAYTILIASLIIMSVGGVIMPQLRTIGLILVGIGFVGLIVAIILSVCVRKFDGEIGIYKSLSPYQRKIFRAKVAELKRLKDEGSF